MNPDLPKTPQEEMEARLIALLLGELSEQEAAAWRAAITTNPDLAKLHDRLKQTISLVREATAKVTEPASEQAAPLQLSEERREKLLAHFKTVRPREFASPRHQLKSWLVPMAATAVLVLLLSAIAIPNFVRSRSTSQASAIVNNLRQLDSAKQQWALEHGKSPLDVPTFEDIKDYVKGRGRGELPPSVAGETYVLGKVGEPVLAEVDASVAKRRLSRLSVEQNRQTVGEPRVRLFADNKTAYAVEEAAKTTLGFRTWGLERAGTAPAESRGSALFDMAVPQGGRPVSTQQERGPTAQVANAPAPQPNQAVTEAELAPPPSTVAAPPQIVLPSAGDSESSSIGKGTEITADRGEARRPWSVGASLRGFYEDNKDAGAVSSPDLPGGFELAGILERPESARSSTNQSLGRYSYSAPPARAGGVERFHRELDRNATVDPTTGLPVATPESGFAEPLAEAQRMFYERYGLPASDGRQVSIPTAMPESGRDLNRTPPATPPPPAAAAIAVNDAEPSTLAGRGTSPTTGLPMGSVSPDGAALGQTLTETRADPTQTRSYGLGTAIGKGIAPSGGMGGGGGGGGAIAAGGAANLLAQTEPRGSRGRGAYLGAGSTPAAPQNVQGQVAAGDFVAGFVVTPTPALQPAKPQEAVPLPAGSAMTEPHGDKVPVLGDTPWLGMLYRNDGSGKLDKTLSDAMTAFKPEVPRVRVKESLRRQPSSVVLPSMQTETAEALENAGAANKPVQDRNVLVETGKAADTGVRFSETALGDYYNDGALDAFVGVRGEDSKKSSVGVKPAQVELRQLARTRGRPEDGRDTETERLREQDANRRMVQVGALAPLEPEIRAAQKKVDDLRKQHGISDLDALSSAPAPMLEAEPVRRLNAQLYASETYVEKEKARLKELEKLTPEQRRGAIQTTVGTDDQLGALLGEYNQVQQKLSASQKDYAPDHPDYQKAKAKAEDAAKRVDARVEGVMAGLKNRVNAQQAAVDKLKDKLEEARSTDIAKARSNRPYYDAKMQLDELLKFRSALRIKMAAEGIDSSLPKTAMVEILDRAEPATEKTGFWRSMGAPIGGTYESAARVRVEHDNSDVEGFTQRAPSAAAYDPYFIQTESEVIQSEAVLAQAVDKLNLDEKWAKIPGENLKKDEAIALLKQRLDLKPNPKTSVLEIRAKSDKPDEAAAIANAVAEAYTGHRLEKGRKLIMGGIEALKEQFGEVDKKVAQAQRELERVATESKVELADLPIRKPATNAPIPQPEIQASENAFSTFSLNVSDVSFKLAAASLEKGQMPDQASIRSEEFLNAFDYRDPEPPPGVPVAFAWERARYAFAHNRDLLRFSIKTGAVGRQAGRALNLVLLLDNSGSMERSDRVHIIREALRVLAGQLQSQDKISVITFARTPRLWVDGASRAQAGEVADQIAGLTPQGGTNLEEAMTLAYQTALRHYVAGGVNRVVVLTDGAANLGNVEPESLKQKVETHRKQGIALDCFGIGWEGFNDDLLEVLSRNGDGRYGFINSPEEAATEFAGQLAGALQVAASDVKVQVEFNPARVTAYRQIGYAKHQLTKEQFRDNTVDAAEIAAQEAGNALYTVEVNPAGEGPLCIVRVRFKFPGTVVYREHEWAVPYNGSAVSLEQASPVMRLAASASAFSEWLVASPFAAEVSPDALLGYLSGVPEIYGADARPKKLEWMIRQAKSIEGN